MSNPVVQIQIRGAGVVILDNRVYAALIPPPNTASWVVTPGPGGSVVFTDQSSGLVLAAPATDPGTQAIVIPAPVPAAVTSWRLMGYSDDEGDDAVAINDPSQLQSGYYTIEDPGSGNFLFRNLVEDRSLLPKFVGFPRTQGDVPSELVIQIVGEV